MKWIEKGLDNVSVRAMFTDGAIKFIKAKYASGPSVLITLSHRYVGSRKGPSALPLAEIRLGVADPSKDFASVESNARIPLLVARDVYEVFKHEKIPLIVTTSGFWRFKKLDLKPDLSWLMYSREELRRKARR